MKIQNTINNIQAIRQELEVSDLKKQLELIYLDSIILVWNFWFIIVPKDNTKNVIKIYSTKEYYQKEQDNYKYLWNIDIIIPEVLSAGKKNFWSYTCFYMELQNVRTYYSAFDNITNIEVKEIWKILSLIHNESMSVDGKSYIHGNLHPSNFFMTEERELWIFDFVSMHYGDLEYDIANIYFYSNYNDIFLEKILENYKFQNKIKNEKIYIHTLLKIRENIKGNIYIDEEKKDILRKDILKIKKKLWNIT